jgi:hypothetical protein
MNASDTLDVIHYFMEQDMDYSSGEQLEGQSALRSRMYRNLYDTEYKYATAKTKNNNIVDLEFGPENDVTEPAPELGDVKPFNPRAAAPRKAYVPATSLDENAKLPFGSALDAPLQ